MKTKRILLLIPFILLISITSVNAYSVYFTVEDNHLDVLTGFQFDVVDADITGLNLIIYNTTDLVLSSNGAVFNLAPGYPWIIDKVTSPTDGVYGLNQDLTHSSTYFLTPGVVLSLEGSSSFTLDNFVLSYNLNPPKFEFPYPFKIAESDITDGKIYTATAVPIPGALWLLGFGIDRNCWD